MSKSTTKPRAKARPKTKLQAHAPKHEAVDYQKMLTEALTKPGELAKCYSVFHNYSWSNQWLAWAQIGAQPINTYKGWAKIGRQVKAGERAIELVMPVTIPQPEDEVPEGEEPKLRTVFIWRRNWFGLNQTEGTDYEPTEAPGWIPSRTVKALDIELTSFANSNGNIQGYASGRKIAINPVAQFPNKTLWHELGHIVLGHTDHKPDGPQLERNIKEVEAESVAYILANIFGDAEPQAYSRGYIQNWLATDEFPAESAKRIFRAVDTILKANKEA